MGILVTVISEGHAKLLAHGDLFAARAKGLNTAVIPAGNEDGRKALAKNRFHPTGCRRADVL